MSEKFGKLPTGPRSRESADYLNHAFETSDIDEICKAIGVVTHRHNISDIRTDSYQNYVEGSVGYRFNFDKFTLRPSVAIGNTGGTTGLGASSTANAYYYALYLAGDLKLNSQWTWNMFELRYRDAFDYTWITPRGATGLTYEWSAGNFVYGNVGYA